MLKLLNTYCYTLVNSTYLNYMKILELSIAAVYDNNYYFKIL